MKNDISNYLDDPDIVDEPMALREIHAIRFMIQEEAMYLTADEKRLRTRKSTDDVMEKYGLKYLLI